MALICRKLVCVSSPEDDDVIAHSATPTHTATMTITWTEDAAGDRHVEVRSDDAEAERILLELLNRHQQQAAESGVPV
jgi:hypothetical protein